MLCNAMLERTTLKLASSNGNLRASPVCTSTLSATPSIAALLSVPADRRLGGRSPQFEGPARELLDGGLVSCQQRGLECTDRPPPGVLRVTCVPALAPACRRAPQPLSGTVVARHQVREAC